MTKILCVFTSLLVAANAFSAVAPSLVECGGQKDHNEPVSYSSPTIVTSSNFDIGDYDNNERCKVVFIMKKKPTTFRLNFTDFELEDSYNCGGDSVCVNGYEYCGRTLKGAILFVSVPAYRTFTLGFRSNLVIVKPGFRVLVDAFPGQSEVDAADYQDKCLDKDYGKNRL